MTIPSFILGPLNAAADFFLAHPALSALLFIAAILLLFHWIRRVIALAFTTAILILALYVGWRWMQKKGLKTPKALKQLEKILPDSLSPQR